MTEPVQTDIQVERLSKMSTVGVVLELANALETSSTSDLIAAAIEIGKRIERRDLAGVSDALAAVERTDGRRPQRVGRTEPEAST